MSGLTPPLGNANGQSHCKSHAGRQRTKSRMVGLDELKPDLGTDRQWRERRISQPDHGSASIFQCLRLRDTFGGIGGETDGKCGV